MTRIARIWYRRNSHKWIDVIQNITDSYNATWHRSIKTAPRDVTPENSPDVFRNIYHELITEKPVKPRYSIGDRVHVVAKKQMFRKAYKQNYSHHVYIIKEILKSKPVTYTILNSDGEQAEGTYYTEELVPAATFD